MIKIRFIGPIKDVVEKPAIEYEIHKPLEIRELIRQLISLYGDEFEEQIMAKSGDALFYQIIINGRNIQKGRGLDTVINDKDEVLISIPIVGG